MLFRSGWSSRALPRVLQAVTAPVVFHFDLPGLRNAINGGCSGKVETRVSGHEPAPLAPCGRMHEVPSVRSAGRCLVESLRELVCRDEVRTRAVLGSTSIDQTGEGRWVHQQHPHTLTSSNMTSPPSSRHHGTHRRGARSRSWVEVLNGLCEASERPERALTALHALLNYSHHGWLNRR